MQTLIENELAIETSNIRNAAMVLRALNHHLRLQILKLIHYNGKLTVTDIHLKLKIEQSVASQHLAILRKERVVTDHRTGKYIYYSVNYDRLKDVQVHALKLV